MKPSPISATGLANTIAPSAASVSLNRIPLTPATSDKPHKRFPSRLYRTGRSHARRTRLAARARPACGARSCHASRRFAVLGQSAHRPTRANEADWRISSPTGRGARHVGVFNGSSTVRPMQQNVAGRPSLICARAIRRAARLPLQHVTHSAPPSRRSVKAQRAPRRARPPSPSRGPQSERSRRG
jgi:hypothetical protein